jgi:hypothetical protein
MFRRFNLSNVSNFSNHKKKATTTTGRRRPIRWRLTRGSSERAHPPGGTDAVPRRDRPSPPTGGFMCSRT